LEFEIVNRSIEEFDITEDGSIFIGKGSDFTLLVYEDVEIDLKDDFKLEGLKVSQKERCISFPEKKHLDYFKSLGEFYGKRDCKKPTNPREGS